MGRAESEIDAIMLIFQRFGPQAGGRLVQLPKYSREWPAKQVARGAWATSRLRRQAEPEFWDLLDGLFDIEPEKRTSPSAAATCRYLCPHCLLYTSDAADE